MGKTIIIQPEVTIALASADLTVGTDPHKVLIVGQILVGGSAADKSLHENVSLASADTLFGRDSMLASMVRAFKRINGVTQVDCLALDDAGGNAATWTITVVGTATEAGTLTVTAGSQKNHTVTVAVANTDTPTDIADSIVSAVNADADIPVLATSTAGVVTLTALNKGVVCNTLPIEVIGGDSIAGVASHLVANADTGTTDPPTTGIFDLAGTTRYQTVVFPYSGEAQVGDLKTFLDARFNPTNDILDGVAIVPIDDSHTDVLTELDRHNSQSVLFLTSKVETEANYEGPAMAEAGYDRATTVAAIRALRLTLDASISRYVTSSASLDQFGGPGSGSLPYFNSPVPQMPVIKTGRGWTGAEIATQQGRGGSVMGNNPAGDGVIFGEMVTTYLTDAASNPDPTFTFLNYVDTSSLCREYFWNNLRKRFSQSRLTDGSVSRGRDMANDIVIRGFCERLYLDLAGPGFVLVQDGEDALVFFKENLNITLDLALGKVTITMQLPIVTQLRKIIMTIKVAFSTEV